MFCLEKVSDSSHGKLGSLYIAYQGFFIEMGLSVFLDFLSSELTV